jgi:hypothetical protein
MIERIVIAALFIILSGPFYEVNSIVGRWKDESFPSSYQYEFKKGNEFVYTYKWNVSSAQTTTHVYKGVWETGEWIIPGSSSFNKTCNLTIYVGTEECCFDFRFAGKNLVLTNKYSSSSLGDMCEDRVLIREE